MRLPILLGCTWLIGCSTQTTKAEEQYEIVKKSGRAAEICEAGRLVVKAYLEAGKRHDYAKRKTATAIECATAETEQRLGIFRMPDGSKKVLEADDLTF